MTRVASFSIKAALVALVVLLVAFSFFVEWGLWPLWNTLFLAALLTLLVGGAARLIAWISGRGRGR